MVDGWGGEGRQYPDFTDMYTKRAVGTTHILEIAFCERGSIDRDGEESPGDGEELCRKHHGVDR